MRSTPDNGTAVDTGYVTGSPRLDFRVLFATTGTYQVWLRGRAGGSSAGTSDSAHAGIDGAAIATADRINGFTTSFGWTRGTLDGVNATLAVTSTGVRTINLWMREDGFVRRQDPAHDPTPSSRRPAPDRREPREGGGTAVPGRRHGGGPGLRWRWHGR
jgi:hypothetical protein